MTFDRVPLHSSSSGLLHVSISLSIKNSSVIGIRGKWIHQLPCGHFRVLSHEITTQHDSLSQGIRVFIWYRRVLFVFVGFVLFLWFLLSTSTIYVCRMESERQRLFYVWCRLNLRESTLDVKFYHCGTYTKLKLAHDIIWTIHSVCWPHSSWS